MTHENQSLSSPDSREIQRFPLSLVILLSVLTISLFLNTYFFRQVRALRSDTKAFEQERKEHVGEVLRPFQLESLNHSHISVVWSSTPATILYYFSPDCVWCRRNTPQINALYKRFGGHDQFIAMSQSDVRLTDFIQRTGLRIPIIGYGIPRSLSMRLGLLETPDTFLINRHGKVIAEWGGAYMGTTPSRIAESLASSH